MNKSMHEHPVSTEASRQLMPQESVNLLTIVVFCALTYAAATLACPGDSDGDGEVGPADFALFHACCAGPTNHGVDPDCDAFDFDHNGDVDLSDFRVFQNHFGTCPCELQWAEELFPALGTIRSVHALLPYDNGTGPVLYVAGSFPTAGDSVANGIARWDGVSWSSLGDGLGAGCNAGVHALVMFDDGSGPALYAGGEFTAEGEGGTDLHGVAMWGGASWLPLANGLDGPVYALAVFDDGTGPALFAGGEFTVAGGQPANNIAKWDGESWSVVGVGTDGPVRALNTYDDGNGLRLYVGGTFLSAGGVTANHIAQWDGVSWSALGDGVSGFSPISATTVEALEVFDDGTGPALYVGGSFSTAGEVTAQSIARWDGTSWSEVGLEQPGLATVTALRSGDIGSGAALYVGTQLHGGVRRWDGSSWSRVGNTSDVAWCDGQVRALAFLPNDDSSRLIAAGDFDYFGIDWDVPVGHIAQWDGATWAPLAESGMHGGVNAFVAGDDGIARALYAGGSLRFAGDTPVSLVAKWDGASWHPVGDGLHCEDPHDGGVEALEWFDDGQGVRLYAAGRFRSTDGWCEDSIARWDGTSWTRIVNYQGPTHFTSVQALEVFDDGTGASLYVGGSFILCWGPYSCAINIAKWDGTSWHSVGDDLTWGEIRAMTVFDDGTGPALYVGGWFPISGEHAHIAKWDGNAWSSLGAGVDVGWVTALEVYDDGTGPALYVGGTEEPGIAKWDGTIWSLVGNSMDDTDGWVRALAVFDDGTGQALYAAGSFSTVGGVTAASIAKWDGLSWSPLGAGLNGQGRALIAFDDGTKSALYVGGWFSTAGENVSAGIAKWYRPTQPCP